MMEQLLLASLFNIGRAIIYDLLFQWNLKSTAIHFGAGVAYACLSCVLAIGIVVAPIVNLISIITRLALSKEVIPAVSVGCLPSSDLSLKDDLSDLIEDAPILNSVNLSTREQFIQNKSQEARKEAAVVFDQLVSQNNSLTLSMSA